VRIKPGASSGEEAVEIFAEQAAAPPRGSISSVETFYDLAEIRGRGYADPTLIVAHAAEMTGALGVAPRSPVRSRGAVGSGGWWTVPSDPQ
jgi:hypothetical protein